MEILNLATREKQDEILGYFDATPLYFGAPAGGGQLQPLIDIQGSGLLLFLSNGSASIVYVRVTIDGQRVLPVESGYAVAVRADQVLPLFIGFKESLLVEHSANVRGTVALMN